MAEYEAFIPLIGLLVTGGIVPIAIKKMDLGKSSGARLQDKLTDEIEKLKERVRLNEIDIAAIKKDNHK